MKKWHLKASSSLSIRIHINTQQNMNLYHNKVLEWIIWVCIMVYIQIIQLQLQGGIEIVFPISHVKQTFLRSRKENYRHTCHRNITNKWSINRETINKSLKKISGAYDLKKSRITDFNQCKGKREKTQEFKAKINK